MSRRLHRREVLRAASAAGLSASSFGGVVIGRQRQTLPEPNPITEENQREGTTDWQLTRVRVNRGRYRTALIEGYCSHQSAKHGDTVRVFVSTEPARHFRFDLYRMGYYGGTGARLVKQMGPLPGRTQPTPPLQPKRIRECLWETSLELTIERDWPSGVYLGKLTTVASANEPYWQSYVIFIVRDDRPADLLFQCSDNTWQAYNRWPENESLYTHPDGAHAPDVAVSFDRPYGKYCQIFEHPLSIGSGEFLLWEFPLCYWLEQHGYNVTYCSNRDVNDSSFVTRCRTFLSVGHDEYWDVRQYHAVRKAIQQGVNVLWLGANSVYMVSPYSPSSSGTLDRIIERKGSYGPLRRDEVATYGEILGPFKEHGPDERAIIGARTIVPFNGGGDWICTLPDHWIFTGTHMQQGEAIPGLVGWEFHGEPDVQRAGLQVVARGTCWSGGTRPAEWTATIFPGPKNNYVFNASTIYWAQGLSSPPGHILPWSHYSRPHGPDPRVQQITRNLLQRPAR